MGLHKALVGTLVITAGTDSNVLSVRELSMARALIFDCSGEATFAGTITVLAGVKDDTVFASLAPVRIQPTAADVVLTAAKINIVEWGGYESIGIKASATDTVSIPVYALLDLGGVE
jgi:hypothetical protein